MAQILTFAILIGLTLATVDYVTAYFQGRAAYREYVTAQVPSRAGTTGERAAPRTADIPVGRSEGVGS